MKNKGKGCIYIRNHGAHSLGRVTHYHRINNLRQRRGRRVDDSCRLLPKCAAGERSSSSLKNSLLPMQFSPRLLSAAGALTTRRSFEDNTGHTHGALEVLSPLSAKNKPGLENV